MKFSSIEAHLPKLPQKLWRWISFVLAAVVVANLAIAFNSQRTVAADRIIFFYGPIEASVPYVELEAFAQTGAVSPSVRDIVRVSGGDEDLIRDVLTEELSVDLVFLDKAANHIMGRFLLAQIGEVIFPPSGLERVKALRAR
ncbi:MAG: alpha/beta hydrolase [Coleofasciculaceae cyanobacterium SM2_3_26]|nr:alpha/beta hydrolase [Coleofasciculaceae cyanobacterium SM2_3_26]